MRATKGGAKAAAGRKVGGTAQGLREEGQAGGGQDGRRHGGGKAGVRLRAARGRRDGGLRALPRRAALAGALAPPLTG